ncbi:MAG: beta-lactamase [Rickettsiaceae bacterium]|jgi:CubicO group peptidase (beta-lactamase class C family)|nr:beta-lactamase [Rickettsiaceae bacterium]
MLKRFYLILFLTLCPLFAYGRNELKIQDLVRHNMQSGAILIVHNGEILHDEAFGHSDTEKQRPNSPSIRFLIGSITKQFTASAIIRLSEKGLIDLGKSLSSYLPEYKAKWANEVTIHQLLSHTSGVPNYLDANGFTKAYEYPQTTQSLIKLIENMPLHFKPGSRFEYSGSGYNLLGAVIENVTGLAYGEYLKKEFFIPLGMNFTTAPHKQLLSELLNKAEGNSIAQSYDTPDGLSNDASDINMSMAFAEACIIANTHDLYKWQKALYQGRAISKAGLEKMLTRHSRHYGYGTEISQDFGSEDVYLHTGRIGGYESLSLYDPLSETHIIILSNQANTRIYQLAKDIYSYITIN